MRIVNIGIVVAVGLLLLSRSPVGAATPTKLSGAALGHGQDVTAASTQINPGGSRDLYLADQDADNVFEIFSLPIAGGTPLQLNRTFATNGDVLLNSLHISPDGSRVLYYADRTTDEVFKVFSVPIAGGAPIIVTHGNDIFTQVDQTFRVRGGQLKIGDVVATCRLASRAGSQR